MPSFHEQLLCSFQSLNNSQVNIQRERERGRPGGHKEGCARERQWTHYRIKAIEGKRAILFYFKGTLKLTNLFFKQPFHILFAGNRIERSSEGRAVEKAAVMHTRCSPHPRLQFL